MIKHIAFNKIIVSTLCLSLFLMFTFLPSKNEIKHETIISEVSSESNYVFLLDEDNYVSRVSVFYDSDGVLDNIRKRIEYLKNGRDYFYPLMNKNTKINKLYVDKDNVFIDFSKEFLDVNMYLEEEMIESLVYSLSEINGINKIYINVEGEEFRRLPHSGKEINYPLDRSFGINKEYNVSSLLDIDYTTVFFSKSINDYEYMVPVTKVSNTSASKIDIIISELKSSVNTSSMLDGLIHEDARVVSSNIMDDKMEIIFDGELIEETCYLISASVFENYEVNEVVFLNENDEKFNIIHKK